ncbi:hypothetical protein [Acinetobacter baumannii]|uniref:hypothetical protein n=1 Tax=Acinetobacter baumannii TaxID=470 RepID=UPI0010209B6B|nr:hypothetical protein [Acinetobacter baumannii]RYL23844.1 hypothetical protein EWO64_03985 [Acinetobacter baumannii]
MTMLVIINHEENAILAADKRSTYFHDENTFEVISDSENKIVDWNGGYITGTGYVPLLTSIKNAAASDNVWTYGEIEDALKNTLNTNVFHQHWINTTNFASIYLTSKGTMAVLTQAKNCRTSIVDKNTCTILVKDVDVSSYEDEINTLLQKKSIDFLALRDCLIELFEYVSKHNATVSKAFDFAIVNNEGRAFTTFNYDN